MFEHTMCYSTMGVKKLVGTVWNTFFQLLITCIQEPATKLRVSGYHFSNTKDRKPADQWVLQKCIFIVTKTNDFSNLNNFSSICYN